MITERLARFALELSADVVSLRRAQEAVIDTLGVAFAARSDPTFTILLQTLGHTEDGWSATVWGSGRRTNALDAALLNGTTAHALDFDDVADEVRGHPSAVLVPALMAAAEASGLGGREVLEAYVAGFETACAVAAGLVVDAHYERGWHATSTVGVIGATAAAGRLLGLKVDRLRRAFAIAASMAAGSRQNFGTMTKPLHAGLAARSGLLAARLAANGFTADPSQLEKPIGFFNMYSDQPDYEAVERVLQGPRVLAGKGLSTKKFPCCYNVNRSADAAIALHNRGIDPRQVERCVVTVEPSGLEPLIHHRPHNGTEAKFSMEYVIAVGLWDGRIAFGSFEDSAVRRPEIQGFLPKVQCSTSLTPPFGPARFDYSYATVELFRSDGSVVRERCDVPRGDARMQLTDAERAAKFADCLRHGGLDIAPDQLLERLTDLTSVTSFADLWAMLIRQVGQVTRTPSGMS